MADDRMLIFQGNAVNDLTGEKKIAGDFKRTGYVGHADAVLEFAKRKLPGEVWKYIDNLKLHIYEMRHLPEETRRPFQSVMRIVVDFLAEGSNYRSDRKVKHKAALIKMIRVLSGETDTEDVEEWFEEQGIGEEDEITVCELFDQYESKGRNEGIIEGEKCGEARRLVADIENAMSFFR